MNSLKDKTLVIASHNKGKVREIDELMQGLVGRVVSASDLSLPEPEETEKTFEGNAALKARAAALASGEYALADDSGLCVNALGGEPGVYSARWAGPEKDFNLAMQKVQDALGDSKDRTAYFISVLALSDPQGQVETFEGRIEGTLIWPPRGDKGFGYDPMFIADGMDKTFAEIDPVLKNRISHRARAFEMFYSVNFGRNQSGVKT